MMPYANEIPVQDKELIDCIQDCVNACSEDTRLILELVFYDRIPYSELAGLLGCAKSHAWRKTRKAMKEFTAVFQSNNLIKERYKQYDSI